jgi:hypothetical protein
MTLIKFDQIPSLALLYAMATTSEVDGSWWWTPHAARDGA